ncbi:MAG: hypothetical protein PHE41_05890, partial [Eubacteriales bacterium]|nr:hypothetical protein [Eubacteriales bacterium]
LKEAITRAGSMDTDTIIKEMEKADYPGAFGRVVFTSPQEKNAHDVKFGPGYEPICKGLQWGGYFNTGFYP